MSIFTGMTKTLQDSIRPKKGATISPILSSQQIFPVLSAQILLSGEKRQSLLKSLKLNSGLPKSYFDTLYLEAVFNFAEYVQNLPEIKTGPYGYMGGLLDHALERAVTALTLCRTYLYPDLDNKTEKIEFSQEETLWIYAVFTSALIMGVGKIVERYHVMLCEKDGTTVAEWLPYASSMLQQGTYYKFEFEEKNRDYLRNKTTTALGWKILPAAGFNWISSDKDLLQQWFEMLDENSRTVGALMTIIKRAEAQILAKYFNLYALESSNPNFAELLKLELSDEQENKPTSEENTQKEQPEKPKVGTENEDKPKTSKEKQAQNAALTANILQWIRKGIENGSFSINKPDSFVYSVQEGILILPEMFKQYTQQNTQFAWQNIYKMFTQFMVSTGTTNEMAYRYLAEQQKSKTGKGLVIKNPYLILPNEQIPPVNQRITLTDITKEEYSIKAKNNLLNKRKQI